MKVASHEQTTNAIVIVCISFIDKGEEEKQEDSNIRA